MSNNELWTTKSDLNATKYVTSDQTNKENDIYVCRAKYNDIFNIGYSIGDDNKCYIPLDINTPVQSSKDIQYLINDNINKYEWKSDNKSLENAIKFDSSTDPNIDLYVCSGKYDNKYYVGDTYFDKTTNLYDAECYINVDNNIKKTFDYKFLVKK